MTCKFSQESEHGMRVPLDGRAGNPAA